MEELQVCSSWEDIEENPSLLDQQLERLKLEKCSSGTTTTSGSRGELSNEDGGAIKIKILKREKPTTDPKNSRNQPGGGDNNSLVGSFVQQVTPIVLDPTREESLRTQYIPPEPKITLLTRPKKDNTHRSGGNQSKSKSTPQKSLEQREKEYMEARKRILGDVTYPEDEEGTGGSESDGTGLSPAEILKQKVAQAMKQEGSGSGGGSSEDGKNESGSGSGCEESSSPTAAAAAGTTTAAGPTGKSRSKKREKFKTPHQEVPRDFPISKTDSERILRQPRGPDGTSGFANNR